MLVRSLACDWLTNFIPVWIDSDQHKANLAAVVDTTATALTAAELEPARAGLLYLTTLLNDLTDFGEGANFFT